MKTIARAITIAFVVGLLAATACIERKPHRVEQKEDPVSSQLREIYEEDLAMRADTTRSPDHVALMAARHRETVYELLSQAVITDPEDLVRAAYILHHADLHRCRETHLLAHHLALTAVDKGYEDARLLAAIALDRFLIAAGVPQRFGTQYLNDSAQGPPTLYPIDSATTDSERAVWHVPPLDSLKAGRLPSPTLPAAEE